MRKRGKLYETNKHNMPLFMQPADVDREHQNIYDGFTESLLNFGPAQISNLPKAGAGGSVGTGSVGGFLSGIGDKLGGVMGGGKLAGSPMGGLVSAGAGLVGGLANSAISGGLKSGAGSAISGIGSTVGGAVGAVNPVLGAAITVGSNIIGGGVNALWGESVDEEALKEANEGTNTLRNFSSNAGSFDEVKGPEAVANVKDVYKGGVFNNVSDKNEELNRQRREAQMFANRSITNNVSNLAADQLNNALANFSAFGGPLDMGGGALDYGLAMDYLTMKKQQNEAKNRVSGISPMPAINTFGHGGCFNPFALGGDTEVPQDNTKVFRPMMLPIQRQQNFSDSDYFWDAGKEYPAGLWKHKDGTFHTTGSYSKDIILTQEEADSIIRATKAKNRREKLRKAMENHKQTNSSENLFAFGGDMQTNSSDFPTGLMHIDAGQSHEQNPNEGVQLGVDPEGTPNLVEEGETVFDDYVYSNRILADAQTKEKFGLPRKKDITFADISKKLEKESSERPNDPISQAGLKAQMHQLADEQERQKQEMDAQRAKAAFEALSPEEQVAVMEGAAQQEAMAEQAAMQQPSPEELAIAQQQQAMADGTEAMVGQEPQMMAAEGGKLFAPGGYLWDKFWSPVNEYSKKKGNTKGKYQIDKTYKDNIKALEESEAYKAFTDYILNKASDEERLKYFRWIDDNTGRDRVYTNEKGELLDGWQDKYKAARYDGLYGIQHYTPEFDPTLGAPAPEIKPEVATTPEARVFHAMDGDDYDGYIEGELDPNVVGAEVRRETLPNGDTVIYHGRAKTPEEKKAEEEKGVAPKHRAEWLRYAGLFGPAVGLGMMAAGVGRPDTAQLDAAVAGAGDVNTADWKPLGNYLTYRPLDIWFEQNRLNANARATDRAILNSGANQGSKMAGLLAAGYNDQIASGNLFRQAQEYNDNLRKQVAEFNRGTDQFNSEQYGATSRFNADAYNNARRANAQLRLQAAAQKMDADAGWYNSLYGNIAGLFKGIGDIGTENFRMNRIGEMAARGDFGTATDETYGFEPYLTRSNRKSKKNR